MHSVCVSKKNQNAKFFRCGLPEKVSFRDVPMHMVCSVQNRNSMMQQSLQWPVKDQLKDVLKQTFDQNDVDLEYTFIVNQWFTRIGQNFWICNIL